ncbi:MAG: anaerobic ribonucleoside-triphosphate reductase activating protein [Spirochaetes bacterium]|nr:anaerobic ribonucleoside-triphosphate reductase activating protein [Spirochaetota bacterium]
MTQSVYQQIPEQTPLYGFLQKPSLVDFPGKIAAVFFTSGCNFTCGYCHNAQLLGTKKQGLKKDVFTKALHKFREKDWISGVTITGGEPTLCRDIPVIISWLKSLGLAVKFDTNGSNPAMLKDLLPVVDYIAMDIKCGLSSYPEFAGFHTIDTIAASVELIKTYAVNYEFRTTIIEKFHTEEEMHKIGALINGAKCYTLQPFLPREDLPGKEYRTMKRTSPDLLSRYQKLMTQYAENIVWKGKM